MVLEKLLFSPPSVRSDTLIIAWSSAIVSIITSVYAMGKLLPLLTFENEFHYRYNFGDELDEFANEYIRQIKTSRLAEIIGALTASFAILFFSVMLAIGVYKKKPLLMYPWISFICIVLITNVLIGFGHAWNYGIDQFAFCRIVNSALVLYSFLTVLSHCVHLTIRLNETDIVNQKILEHECKLANNEPIKQNCVA
ncbi:uncharacterized protein LOC142331419 [Lycorma delicatula]|uniref:uncharacterized protein LOC142331419 n=1 Tax=Lycorma delicatula TaxID=130591 RepID=UPI003F50E2FB